MADGLERLLAEMPEPTVPPTIAAAVMARIAREADRATASVPEQRTATRGDWLVWLCALAGLVLVAGLSIHGWLAGASPFSAAPSSLGIGGRAVTHVEASALLLVLGVWLFLVGLFGPLRRERRM